MAVFSGKYGNVELNSEVSSVRNWSITESQSLVQYRASNTQAGTARIAGIYDFSGNFEGYGLPTVMPGDIFDFNGYTAPDDPSVGAEGEVIQTAAVNDPGGEFHLRPGAICESVTVNWDWTTGELLNYSVNFANANGLRLLHTAATNQTDASTFTAAALAVCGPDIIVEWGDAAAEAEIQNMLTASLTINSNNLTVINSSTNCGTLRIPGVVDASVSLTLQHNDLLFITGSSQKIRLYVTASTFYELKDMICENISDLTVDNDSGQIIQYTINLSMNCVDPDDQSLGWIARPGETTRTNDWWPDTYNDLALT